MNSAFSAVGVMTAAILFAAATAFAESPDAGRIKLPTGKPTQTVSPGLQKLGGHDGFLYVPAGYHAGQSLPLLILLHKAGGNASEWFRGTAKGPHGLFAAHADADHFAILAPDAGSQTWGSGSYKSFGYDAITVNNALAAAFARCSIDRNRIAIGGFSDGASYALSLGLANGDLFSAIVAFSPGYIVGAPGRGKPVLFIAHGGGDNVLPISTTSRIFVAQLRRNGYQINFREFGGGHAIQPGIADEAMTWLAGVFRRGR